MADDVLCLLTCVIKNPPSMTSSAKNIARKKSSIRRSATLAALVPPRVDEAPEMEDG